MVRSGQEMAPGHALGRSAEELAAELLEIYRVEPLELHWDSRYISHGDAKVDVSQDPIRAVYDRSRPAYVPGTRITLHVPFSGEADLFKAKPSRFMMVLPTGAVRDNELRLTAIMPTPIQRDAKTLFDTEVGRIKDYVSWVNADVEKFNNRLEGSALRAAQTRREKVMADHALVESLGLPVKREEDAPRTYVAPTVRRKATRPAATPTRRVERLEPVFAAEEYEHILDIVRGMVSVIERSPRAFRGMGEEDLRQHFLVQLNGQYQGQATGETFNFDGKTDILIRHHNRNLFIAECKFWTGPKKLTETLDQLLGYAAWRDTKIAIFLFNRRRDLSKLLEQISPRVAAHPNFVREIKPYGGETDFRFVLRHRDDTKRELTLTVLVFEVPT